MYSPYKDHVWNRARAPGAGLLRFLGQDPVMQNLPNIGITMS